MIDPNETQIARFMREDTVISNAVKHFLEAPSYCNCDPACEDWRDHLQKRMAFEDKENDAAWGREKEKKAGI